MNKPNVINFHFIDYCNYSCKYCFVKKESKMLSLEKVKLIINNIKRYFEKNHLEGRINLVGGEIFLCPYLQEIIDYIYSLNIKISIVTNGSLLTEQFILLNKEKLDTIGISIDSLNNEINLNIGRCCNGKVLEYNKLIRICSLIKENKIKLKINLCISKLNYEDDIISLLEIIKPDRFKILQMTIIQGINNDCKSLCISEKTFLDCIRKYEKFNPIIESSMDLKSSYVMIDSNGELFCNKEENSLGNLLNYELDNLIDISNIDILRFNKRYFN